MANQMAETLLFLFHSRPEKVACELEDENREAAWPRRTPAITRSIATQNVGVMDSPRQAQAQLMVLSGMRLLNSSTWLVGQRRKAWFQIQNVTTLPPRMQ